MIGDCISRKSIMMLLKYPHHVIDLGGNNFHKVLVRVRHVGLIVIIRTLYIMPEILKLEDYCFGFIRYRIFEDGNSIIIILDKIF